MRTLSLIILFALLIGSDVIIGFVGHYLGSTNNEFSVLIIVVTAVIVVLFVKFVIKRG